MGDVKELDIRDRARAARARAESLVAQMTKAEKLQLVISYFPLISPRAQQLGMVPSSGFTRGIERLGIPDLCINDASLGVANVLNCRADDTATALPCALATGASFDPETARMGGAMIGAESRSRGFNVMLAGGINLTRDPWCGRNFEYLGEDPVHTGILGGAHVAGVQSNRIASTVKHLALNSQETGRMIANAVIDREDLRESDLLAFEIAIEIGRPASVMTGYNKVNGEWCGENSVLIGEILKGDWGFQGWVMSDWGAVHSTEKAALAGLDQESGLELDKTLNGAVFFTDRLEEAVESGLVPLSRIDDMAARVLVGMIACGALDTGATEPAVTIDYDAHAAVAQTVAERGCVLLRNVQRTLPLPSDIARIAIIGGHADVGVLSGGGSSQVRSRGGAPIERALDSGDAAWFCRETYHASSPLEAIARRVPNAQVLFESGGAVDAARTAAASCDAAIVFLTKWSTEAVDATTLALDPEQDALVTAVSGVNSRTIVVLETGGPVLMPWADRVAGILQAWYPGQRGGEAIARLLFGDANPSGRLPITFPASDSQAPRPQPCGLAELAARDAAVARGDRAARIAPFDVDYPEGANCGYRWHELRGHEPLYPFGFGLSYTSFAYTSAATTGGPRPSVAVCVENTGGCAGADVPQIYVRAADRNGLETWRLAGFARVELAAGESRKIVIPLEPRSYARWHEAAREWRWPAGPLPFVVARSATDHVIEGLLDISATS